MKKTVFFALLLIIFFVLSPSDSQQIQPHPFEYSDPQSAETVSHFWVRTYGTERYDEMGRGVRSINSTSDGGFLISGSTNLRDWYFDIFIMKLDSNGRIEWQRLYGTEEEDKPYGGVHETVDGGYIVVGFTMASVYGTHVVWVLKLTSNGDIEWQRTYGAEDVMDFPYASDLTSDGGYIISGQTYMNRYDYSDVWVLKLDSSGNIEWQHIYGGDDADESGDVIHQTTDGGYVLAGNTRSFGAGNVDYWVLKLDSSGDIEWQRTYGGEHLELAHSILPTRDGGYIVGGRTETFGAGGNDCWILKLSFYGDIEWQRAYGGIGDDGCGAIIEDHEGGYVVGGSTDSFGAGARDLWAVNLNSIGDILWQRTYGGRGIEYSPTIHKTSDGWYVFAGTTMTPEFRNGLGDVMILKLSHEGTIGETCEIVGTSDAQVTETFVSPSDTNIRPTDTDVTPQITDVSPEEILVTTNLLCEFQSASPRWRRATRRVIPNRPK